jgi:ferritin-like metal-binding protein YciE
MNTQTNDQSGDNHAIATYLGDMLALERHIAAPIDAQLSSPDHNEYASAIALITQIKNATERHIAALDARLAAVGGDPVGGVKSAWASLLGGGAAALNTVRKTKVSKSLRDDSTALSLAATGYTMLHATALGLGDQTTAALAKRHLDDIAPIIVDISRTIGVVVLQELRDDGANVVISAAEYTQQATADSWSSSNTGQTAGRL